MGRQESPEDKPVSMTGCHTAYLREIRYRVALIMLFQPIEFLCIHGKCNYPYSIERKIEETQKQKNNKGSAQGHL